MTKRAYKYRFYPTPEQEVQLNQSFGCARKVYNHFLDFNQNQFEQGTKTGYGIWSGMLPALKNELDYLKDVSSVVLQQSLVHLDSAFSFWFSRIKQKKVISDDPSDPYGKPKFKKKFGKNSITYTKAGFRYRDGEITLAKQNEPLDIVWSRRFEGEPSSIVVSKSPTGKFHISILVEEKPELFPVNDNKIGLDVGIESYISNSNGDKIPGRRPLIESQEKLARAQKIVARAKDGGKNKAKKKQLVTVIHEQVANSRNDFLHQLSSSIINKNQVVCVEDLSVKNMLKNHKLARAISDVAWSTFISMLKYKSDWYGRTFVEIDRWFPSSKTCHCCGHKMDKLPLKIRKWTCSECGAEHDRDINAARNILVEGLRILMGAVGDPTAYVKCSSNPIGVPTSGLARGGYDIAMGHMELESPTLA
jgi:putative transposase